MTGSAQTLLLSLVLIPKTPGDRAKLGRGLAWLMGEDPSLAATTDAASGDVTVFCAGEQHLEIVVDRLRLEFAVEAWCGRPQVAFKETVTRGAEGEMKYTAAAGGARQYGHVKLRVEPGERGSGYLFDNALVGGAIPAQFIDPIDSGIKDALAHGVLAGYPVDDVRVVLYDGSYHDLDSSDAAFRRAAAMAFHQAMRRAAPTLLEPLMRLEINVPREFLPAVVGDLTGRRARIEQGEDRAGTMVFTARAPLAELFGYASAVRELSRGRGAHTMHFDGYEPVDPPDDSGGDRDSLVRAPLAPPPTRNVSSIALPEPPGDDSAG